MHKFDRILQVGGHIGASWRIRLNRPSAAAMRPYVKFIWPLVPIVVEVFGIATLWQYCNIKVFAIEDSAQFMRAKLIYRTERKTRIHDRHRPKYRDFRLVPWFPAIAVMLRHDRDYRWLFPYNIQQLMLYSGKVWLGSACNDSIQCHELDIRLVIGYLTSFFLFLDI